MLLLSMYKTKFHSSRDRPTSRRKPYHQNIEIALLKERVGITKDSDDQKTVNAFLALENHQNKRPVRLLPPHTLFRESKNETELQKQINRRRSEQPTNCSDLALLGFTLNGFYLVKSNESSTKNNGTNNDTSNWTPSFALLNNPTGSLMYLSSRNGSFLDVKSNHRTVEYFSFTQRGTEIGSSVDFNR